MVEQSTSQVVYAHYPQYLRAYAGSKFLHRHYLIRLQVEGQCRAQIDGEWESFRAGDLLLLAPGQYSQFWFEPDPESGKVLSGNYTIMCRGDWLEGWWQADRRPQKANILPSDSMMAVLKELVLERRWVKAGWKEASDGLLRALCVHIDRSLQTSGGEPQSQSFIIQRMKQYIEDDERLASSFMKVKDVARHVGLSESRASHLFKAAVGQSIMAYFLATRLRIARDRIKYMDSTLEHIADISGFGSYSYFHRAFRKKYGVSPNQYRSSLARNPTLE